MRRSGKLIWPFVLFLCAISSIWYSLYYIAGYPHRAVHELGGDGLKNYYSYIYHATYGSGWWFDGMNYPYGEHLMFTDGQPALTIPVSWLRNYISVTPELLNVILNMSILLSLLLAIIFVYKLLVHFGVSRAWSVLFAICIAFVSTQNFRLFGGYGLYFPFVTPMTFYWFACYYSSGKAKYMLYSLVLSCVIMFFHPYQFALVFIWSLLYTVAYMAIHRDAWQRKLRHLSWVLMVIIIPVLVFKATQALTDPVTDRPQYPHGLLSYCTRSSDIFSSYYSPYFIYMQQKGYIAEIPAESHGYAYTGVVAIIVTISSLVLFSISFARRRQRIHYPASFSPIWLLLAFGALLFSMGVPFIWNMEWVYDYIASFRQFRALGWFALLFYYIITVYAVVVLHHIYRRAKDKGNKWWALAVFILPALVWAGEAYGFMQRLKVRCLPVNYNHDFFYSKLEGEKDWLSVLKEAGYQPSDFQAILHMPYYHVGSEKIWLANSNWSFGLSLKAAYQLHLPVVDANMSRSSWGTTFKQVKIDSGPYAYKAILDEVADARPYLLMRSDFEQLTPDEQYLFHLADSVGSTSGMIAYALSPAKLKAADAHARSRAMHIAGLITNADTALASKPYYSNHYDSSGNPKKLWGTAAAMPVTDVDTVLTKINVASWPKDTTYECSAWFLANDKNFRNAYAELIFIDSAAQVLATDFLNGDHANDTYGMWFRTFKFLRIPANCTEVHLVFRKRPADSWYALDELLLRSVTDTIISRDARGVIMANNHIIYTP